MTPREGREQTRRKKADSVGVARAERQAEPWELVAEEIRWYISSERAEEQTQAAPRYKEVGPD